MRWRQIVIEIRFTGVSIVDLFSVYTEASFCSFKPALRGVQVARKQTVLASFAKLQCVLESFRSLGLPAAEVAKIGDCRIYGVKREPYDPKKEGFCDLRPEKSRTIRSET